MAVVEGVDMTPSELLRPDHLEGSGPTANKYKKQIHDESCNFHLVTKKASRDLWLSVALLLTCRYTLPGPWAASYLSLP